MCDSPDGSVPHPENRRKEPRFEVSGIGDLTVFNSTKFLNTTAIVLDVSRSGFQIELVEPLDLGTRIELRLREVIVLGEVVNCRPHGPGCYRFGIAISKIVDSPLQARHLPETDLELFVTGNGLSEAQQHFYEAHLEICQACRQSVLETTKFLGALSALQSKSRIAQ